jgi:hypothetical protein
MGAYTYLFADTLTGHLLAELPMTGVTYDLRVNDAAVLKGTISLDDAPGVIDLTTAGRTAVYVTKGGSIRYSGIIWGRQYDSAARTLSIDCQDFLSYTDHLCITSDLTYVATDQLALARSLVSYGMTKGGSNLSLAYAGPALSGVPRDRTYLATDQAFVGARLRELSAVDGGFDFMFSARWEANGYPRRVLQLGYPSLGRAWPASAVVFETDADAVKLTWNEDAGSSASTVYGTGAVASGLPAGTLPPMYTADAPAVRSGGFPRLEAVVAFTDITQLATLTSTTLGKLDLSRLPLQTMQLTIGTAASAPTIGEYLPGDQCLIRVGRGDALWKYGAEIIATIVTVAVAVDDEHNDTVTVGLAPITITQGAVR